MTRNEAISSDVPRLKAERSGLLAAIDRSDDPAAIAVLLRRNQRLSPIDKIEERFDEINLDSQGNPK